MRIVVSAVSFTEGGPLTVLRECLSAARNYFDPATEIIALVHREDRIGIDGIRTIEFPKAKSSWVNRLFLEYRGFKTLSRRLEPDFWLSLHDVTPRLNGERQAVYCHNPAPFFNPSLREAWIDPTLLIFRLVYGTFYRFNIHSNIAVVVQQQWLRDQFSRHFGARNVIVAHPDVADLPLVHADPDPRLLRLFYPTLSRAFKNIELLCEAMAALPVGLPKQPELLVTIDGTENRYARVIFSRYGRVPGVRFIGRQDRPSMAGLFSLCDVLLFPSRLETWGLPITEAKQFGKPMIVADAPYSRETVGTYHAAQFLPPDAPMQWASAIAAVANGTPTWGPVAFSEIAPPYAADWNALWSLLVPDPCGTLPASTSAD